MDEHLRGVGRPRAIHAALGGTFAQLITVIEAPQHRSERVGGRGAGGAGLGTGRRAAACTRLQAGGAAAQAPAPCTQPHLHSDKTGQPPAIEFPTSPLCQQDEEFYQISLDVRGKRTLAESLEAYCAKELMDGQNQYLCEELGKKVIRAERRFFFVWLGV